MAQLRQTNQDFCQWCCCCGCLDPPPKVAPQPQLDPDVDMRFHVPKHEFVFDHVAQSDVTITLTQVIRGTVAGGTAALVAAHQLPRLSNAQVTNQPPQVVTNEQPISITDHDGNPFAHVHQHQGNQHQGLAPVVSSQPFNLAPTVVSNQPRNQQVPQ
eukprot:m.43055 g.43055  ORF g.43055 m.43055 type:complete len:157 (-) comp19287_c0_seq2:613-1083(-)